jgi:hypothetical protein
MGCKCEVISPKKMEFKLIINWKLSESESESEIDKERFLIPKTRILKWAK